MRTSRVDAEEVGPGEGEFDAGSGERCERAMDEVDDTVDDAILGICEDSHRKTEFAWPSMVAGIDYISTTSGTSDIPPCVVIYGVQKYWTRKIAIERLLCSKHTDLHKQTPDSEVR